MTEPGEIEQWAIDTCDFLYTASRALTTGVEFTPLQEFAREQDRRIAALVADRDRLAAALVRFADDAASDCMRFGRHEICSLPEQRICAYVQADRALEGCRNDV